MWSEDNMIKHVGQFFSAPRRVSLVQIVSEEPAANEPIPGSRAYFDMVAKELAEGLQ